jgi:hypothetical protein
MIIRFRFLKKLIFLLNVIYERLGKSSEETELSGFTDEMVSLIASDRVTVGLQISE